MKVYRRHYCDVRHRTNRTIAKCLWPRAVWIVGNGEYALLAHCRGLSVSLWRTLKEAEDSKSVIDYSGCGGACHRNHEIIRLEVEV